MSAIWSALVVASVIVPLGILFNGGGEDPNPEGFVLLLVYVYPFVPFCFLKGKHRLGTVGLFVFGPALMGAVRVARPDSTWARKFYKPGSYKMREAIRRFPIAERLKELDVENARLRRLLAAEADLDRD